MLLFLKGWCVGARHQKKDLKKSINYIRKTKDKNLNGEKS